MEDEAKEKKMSKADLAKEIKAMESKKRQEAMKQVPPPPVEQKVMFDQWHAMRSASIPSHHMKEILKADFAGRGLGNRETMARYDAALVKYGVKLK